jgi:hypothetical protein
MKNQPTLCPQWMNIITRRKPVSLFVLCISFLISSLTHSQTVVPTLMQFKSPKSPNVDRLQSYLEVPTSLNTGQINLSIPLYEINVGSLKVPVSLGYANTGLRIEDIPSWVGLGWNLRAGGLITRTVKGLPDDAGTEGIMSQYSRIASCINNTISPTQRYQFYREIVNGEVDTQFDLYTFDILGRSGKFYINKDGNAVCLPKSNLKIAFTINNGIQNFTMTDESGVQFFFTLREEATSTNSDQNVFGSGYYNWQTGVSWHLTRILQPNGQEVFFEYDTYGLSYQHYLQSLTISRVDLPEGCRISDYQEPLFDVIIPEYHLKKITWNLGHVNFVPGPDRQDLQALNSAIHSPSLASIQVFNSDNELKKRIDFDMIQGNRLLLKSVLFKSAVDGQTDNRYTFNYYNETSTWPSLGNNSPYRYAQDIWGYFNGVQQNSLLPFYLVPFYLASGTYNLAGYAQNINRSPNESFAMWGMLKEVVYPTGGKSVFEYEANQITYPDYNAVPAVLKPAVQITYQTVAEDEVNTDGTSVTTASSTKQFSLGAAVTGARITAIESHNDPTAFANVSSGFSAYPGTHNPLDCSQCGESQVITTNDPYSYTYTRSYVVDLAAGNYTTSVSSSSIDGHWGHGYIKVEIPVAPNNFMVKLGGLRVKRISFNDGQTGDQLIKRYLYDFDGNDKVHVKYLPTFLNTIPTTIADVNAVGEACVGCCYSCMNPMATLSATSISPTPGYYLEYPKVVELIGDNAENGRIVHRFTNTPIIGGGYTNKPYASPAVLDWYGGIEYQSTSEKRLTSTSYLPVSDRNSVSIGENFPNYNNLDMDLKVAVKEANYCLGYPVTVFPDNDNEAAILASSAFAVEFVPVYTENFTTTSTSTIDYTDAPANPIIKQNVYTYSAANKLVPSLQTSPKSDQRKNEKLSSYPEDYSIPTGITVSAEVQGITHLKDANLLTTPLEELQIIEDANGVKTVVGGQLSIYNTNSPTLKEVYQLELASGIPLTSFTRSSVNSSGVLVKDAHYQLQSSVLAYDNYLNPIEILNYRTGEKTAIIWDYDQSLAVCQVTNSSVSDIAYTSFEAESKGNWSYSGTAVPSSAVPTGRKYYSLTPTTPLGAGVRSGQSYIVSYWSNSTGTYSITGGSILTSKTGTTLNGWTYHEHLVSASSSSLNISGSGAIDEVRLYPNNAQMTTYTFDPLVGMTSQCNVNNHVSYYEYDGLNRLSAVRDESRNIIETYKYNYVSGSF